MSFSLQIHFFRSEGEDLPLQFRDATTRWQDGAQTTRLSLLAGFCARPGIYTMQKWQRLQSTSRVKGSGSMGILLHAPVSHESGVKNISSVENPRVNTLGELITIRGGLSSQDHKSSSEFPFNQVGCCLDSSGAQSPE